MNPLAKRVDFFMLETANPKFAFFILLLTISLQYSFFNSSEIP